MKGESLNVSGTRHIYEPGDGCVVKNEMPYVRLVGTAPVVVREWDHEIIGSVRDRRADPHVVCAGSGRSLDVLSSGFGRAAWVYGR